MKRKTKHRQARLKTKLGLPDLEHAKVAVIVSLRSFESQRSYRHSIDEFVTWLAASSTAVGSGFLGLRWDDIDWEGPQLAVPHAYVYGKPGDVKTQASHRWMPLDRLLAERLLQHKARLAPLAKSDDWIFANPETGKPYWPGRIQENWLVPAAKKAGIGQIGWHTFRHYSVSRTITE